MLQGVAVNPNDEFNFEYESESDNMSLLDTRASSTNNQVIINDDLNRDKIAKASLMTLLSQPQFYWIYTMNVLSIAYGNFLLGSAKSWGEVTFNSDEYLSLVLSFAYLFQAMRFIWSVLLDRYSYKAVYGTMLVI